MQRPLGMPSLPTRIGQAQLAQKALHPGLLLLSMFDDYPMSFALLKVADSQPGEFLATESTSKQYGKQRRITFAPDALAVWRLPEGLALLGAQPVTKPQAQLLYTFDSRYSRSQVGAKQPA
jgi:hypothetical protein